MKLKSKVMLGVVAVTLSLLSMFLPLNKVWAEDVDTEADLYISSVRELNEFATKVNNGETYEGKLVELTADIVYDGVTINNFAPIGYSNFAAFEGTFDGNGYTISGMDVTNGFIVGLFGWIGESGVVKNVTVKDSSFVSTAYCGGIAGVCEGTINNCKNVNVSITAESMDGFNLYSGGMVGSLEGTVKNCFSNAPISISLTEDDSCSAYVGGIAGEASGEINNCANIGNVNGLSVALYHDAYAGGIIGEGNANIQNCYNTGIITNGEGSAAGIAHTSYGIVGNCYCSEESAAQNFISVDTEKNCKAWKDSDMKGDEFLAKLNANRGDNYDWFQWEFRSDVSDYPVQAELKDLSGGELTLSQTEYVYDGTAKTPEVTVYLEGVELASDYYTVTYSNSTKVGKAIVKVSGIDDYGYKGTLTAEYSIKLANPKAPTLANDGKGINIKWAKVDGATGYYVYRKTSSTEYVKIATINNISVLSYMDTSVKSNSGTKYSYAIQAFSGEVVSEIGTEKSITRIAQPGLATVTNTADGVKITWSKMSNVDGYYIYKKTGNGSWKKLKKIQNATSYLDKNVKSGTKYSYTLCAYKGSVVGTYNNAGKSITRLAQPKISSVANTTKGVQIKWSKITGATGYVVYRKTSTGKWTAIKTITKASTLSYVDTKAVNGTTYQYSVAAKKNSTNSTYNTTGKKIVRLSSPTVSSLRNSVAKTMKLTWSKNAKSTGYQVQYATNKSMKNSKTKTYKGATSVTKSIAGLTKGKTYYVKVRTYKKVGSTTYYSEWSTVKSVNIKK